jgi:2-polyprenyl-6-hydroxyphenyl methylase/3-demethylubiquinone-9 3-methyltransferase
MKATRPVPVDNEIYNRLSETWWDENEALGLLRTALGPVRFGYFKRVLIEERQRDPGRMKALDLGCGGGLLAEEFARLGCQMTGIDPSEASLTTARKHAQQSGLEVAYQTGVGERIPFPDASFDMVICCDVLEHVNDVARVMQEIARVLTPGGIFFYDTINATFFSWLVAIQLAQEWELTRFLPQNLHDWKQFIKPSDLQRYMQRSGLQNQETKGMSPRGTPLVVIRQFLRYKRAKITLAEMGRRIALRESRDVSILYMGHALKLQKS